MEIDAAYRQAMNSQGFQAHFLDQILKVNAAKVFRASFIYMIMGWWFRFKSLFKKTPKYAKS